MSVAPELIPVGLEAIPAGLELVPDAHDVAVPRLNRAYTVVYRARQRVLDEGARILAELENSDVEEDQEA